MQAQYISQLQANSFASLSSRWRLRFHAPSPGSNLPAFDGVRLAKQAGMADGGSSSLVLTTAVSPFQILHTKSLADRGLFPAISLRRYKIS